MFAIAELALSFDAQPDLPSPLSDVKLGVWLFIRPIFLICAVIPCRR